MNRPGVVELRKGPHVWEFRADFTGGQWQRSFIGSRRPWEEVKEDIVMAYPKHQAEDLTGKEEGFDA